MKKLFSFFCCALFALSLAACGSPAASSSAASSAPASSAPAASASQSASVPPASSVSAPAASSVAPASGSTAPEKEPIPRTIGEDGAVVFGDLHFQMDPADTLEEDDTILRLVYEQGKSFVTISASETSTFGDYSALLELMPGIMVQGWLSAFDSVTEQKDADLTLAGRPAKVSTFIGEMNGVYFSCFAASFNSDSYNYLVALTESTPAESHSEDLLALLESMTTEA